VGLAAPVRSLRRSGSGGGNLCIRGWLRSRSDQREPRHALVTGGWQFDTPSGPRLLRDPDGPPTSRQLLLLAHRALLELRDEPGEPLTKLDAAQAIERVGVGRPRRTDAEVAIELLAAAREYPGGWPGFGTSSPRIAPRHSQRATDAALLPERRETAA
jgi:hypothetical protein